jgi:hypothetical protein
MAQLRNESHLPIRLSFHKAREAKIPNPEPTTEFVGGHDRSEAGRTERMEVSVRWGVMTTIFRYGVLRCDDDLNMQVDPAIPILSLLLVVGFHSLTHNQSLSDKNR